MVSSGKDQLSQAVTAAICRVFKCMDNPGQCWVRDTCTPAAHVVLSQLLESQQLNIDADPFQRWEDYRKFFLTTKTHEMCDDCREWRAELFEAELRKLWMRLPEVFGVQVQQWQS
ncbi:hypothetical protein C8Q74DRAFT_1306335 [Fomes fomentarius]|nr:hypothetical protein C8Q74DRAFT_1306335 [Fomes fomentarius]